MALMVGLAQGIRLENTSTRGEVEVVGVGVQWMRPVRSD